MIINSCNYLRSAALAALLCFVSTWGYTQSFYFKDIKPDQGVNTLVELNDKSVLACSYGSFTDSVTVYHLDQQGAILQVIIPKINDAYVQFISLAKYHGKVFFAATNLHQKKCYFGTFELTGLVVSDSLSYSSDYLECDVNKYLLDKNQQLIVPITYYKYGVFTEKESMALIRMDTTFRIQFHGAKYIFSTPDNYYEKAYAIVPNVNSNGYTTILNVNGEFNVLQSDENLTLDSITTLKDAIKNEKYYDYSQINGLVRDNDSYLIASNELVISIIDRYNYKVARLDSAFNEVDSVVYFTAQINGFQAGFKKDTLFNKYWLVCTDSTLSLNNNVQVFKIDEKLKLLFKRDIKLTGASFVLDIEVASDGGCYVFGVTDYMNASNAFVLKIGPNGEVTGINVFGKKEQTLTAYPNPANDELRLSVANANNNYAVSVINSLGEEVYQAKWNGSNSINTASWANGSYFVLLQEDGALVQSAKIIVQH